MHNTKKNAADLGPVPGPDPSLAESIRSLADPGPDFRGLPFWSWNSKLEQAELRRQIRIFRDMGFGGFFMHPREGLATEYLGKEWFDCVRACADEARKHGMRAWAYDEDRWPSGAAGGIVTASEKYRNRALRREVVDPAEARRIAREARRAGNAGGADGGAVAWFAEIPAADGGDGVAERPAAKPKGERLVDVERPPLPSIEAFRRVSGPGARLRPGEKLVRYAVRVAGGQPRFNGGAYIDVLSKAAVREFVRTTHEAYARALGAEVSASGAIPGFFTDEPSMFDPVPWTASLPAEFRRKFGYDVRDRLPELFAVVGGAEWSKARHDFRECTTALFCGAFAGTIGRWCAGRGALFTGHVLEEDTPRRQADRVGAAMRFYEKMQAPGIDLLTEHWLPVLTAKQCSSAARQCGRAFRLCETYGCTGWDFPLEGHKALGEWLLALGINHRVHHLAWYSMEGRVKRDYPASISRQSPWFRKYKAVEDRFARAGELAGRGREERDLLVLHPVESVWGRRVGWSVQPDLEKRDDAFVALCSTLLSRHLDFDFGDEDVLARRGRVAATGRRSPDRRADDPAAAAATGRRSPDRRADDPAAEAATGRRSPDRRADAAAPTLRVGAASYRAVLVPAGLETVRSSTLALLRAFAAAGGAVFVAGEAPRCVDAGPSDEAAALWNSFRRVAAGDAAAHDAALSPLVRRLSLAQDGEECAAALVHERSRADGTSYFVCNTSTAQPGSVAEMMGGAPAVRDRHVEYPRAVLRIPARGVGTVLEIDLDTGKTRRAAFSVENGFAAIPCPLGRLESRLFVAAAEGSALAASAAAAAPDAAPAAPRSVPIPRTGLAYSLDEPDALVLDMAEWELEGAPAGAACGKHQLSHVLDIDRAARTALGIAPRGDKPAQPWAVEAAKKGRGPWAETGHAPQCGKQPRGRVSLRVRFRVAPGAASIPCEIALERPDLWSLVLNGAPLAAPRRPGWWIDPCLRRIPVPDGALREGENELVAVCDRFDSDHPGLESVFLIGSFAVARPDRADKAEIRPLPATLRTGDLASQGLGNYGGNVAYRFRAVVPATGAVRVAPRRWAGTAIGFSVNGGKEIFRHAPPYEAVFDGPSLRRDGTDEFEIVVYGSRRNQLGPFYVAGGVARPYWTGNAEIDATAEAPRRALVPFGLGAG